MLATRPGKSPLAKAASLVVLQNAWHSLNSCPGSRHVAQTRPDLANKWPTLADHGQVRPTDLGRSWPTSTNSHQPPAPRCPTIAEICWLKLANFFDQHAMQPRPALANSWPKSVDVGRNWPASTKIIWPKLSTGCPCWPFDDQVWPSLGHASAPGATVRRMPGNFGEQRGSPGLPGAAFRQTPMLGRECGRR